MKYYNSTNYLIKYKLGNPFILFCFILQRFLYSNDCVSCHALAGMQESQLLSNRIALYAVRKDLFKCHVVTTSLRVVVGAATQL